MKKMVVKKEYYEHAALWTGKNMKGTRKISVFWEGRVNHDLKAGDRIVMFEYKKKFDADPDYIIRKSEPSKTNPKLAVVKTNGSEVAYA